MGKHDQITRLRGDGIAIYLQQGWILHNGQEITYYWCFYAHMNLFKRVDTSYRTYSVRDWMSSQFYSVTQNHHQSWNIGGRVEISPCASINKTLHKYHNILSWLTPVPHITISPFIASHLLLYHCCPSPSPSINQLHSNPFIIQLFCSLLHLSQGTDTVSHSSGNCLFCSL